MSGQWEVVGRSKQKQPGSKSEKKKIARVSKVEENAPISQEGSLYSALDKENTKPNKEVYIKPNTTKKAKVKHEKKDVIKSSNLKNFETALKMIVPKEIIYEITVNQAKFKGIPLMQLRSIVSYLNGKLYVEIPHSLFVGKPWDYPLCLLHGNVRDNLKMVLKEAGTEVVKPFFEWCLLAMANDLSRFDKGDGYVLGYKLYIQLIVIHYPEVTVNVTKMNELLTSYQNRQNIGLSLLWAFGLVGYKDVNLGFKVWQDVMLNVMELKNYTSYVISYLHSIVTCKHNRKPVQPDELFKIIDTCSMPPSGLSMAHKSELQAIVPLLVSQCPHFVSDTALAHVFVSVLERMKRTKPLSESLKREFICLLDTCLFKDPLIYNTWQGIYERYLPQSTMLIHYLRSNATLSSKSNHYRYLRDSLKHFQVINELLLLSDPSDPHVQKCHQLCSDMKKKMSVSRPFPWMMANFVLLTLIGVLLTYDIQKHGSLDASSTGHLLKDVGVLPYLKQGSVYGRDYYNHAYEWMKINGPLICNDIYNVSKPVLQVAWKGAQTVTNHSIIWARVGQEFAQEKITLAADWVNRHMPGWKEQIFYFASDFCGTFVHYLKIGGEGLYQYSEKGITWARTNVFVGSWSPDNLHQQFEGVLNSTHHYASWTYEWICQKVQILSKIQ